MRKLLILSMAAALMLIACKPKVQPVAVDVTALKESVEAYMENYSQAFSAVDAEMISRFMADDGLFLGSDPGEFFDKKAMDELWRQMAADSLKFPHAIDRREVRVAKDGNSAIVVEQFLVPAVSPVLPVRAVYLLLRNGDSWIIDFYSMSIIPLNEDIPKLNKALE